MTIRPNINAPLVGSDGRISREWVDYLTKQAANIAELEGSATLADVIAKINELLAALEAAGMSKKD